MDEKGRLKLPAIFQKYLGDLGQQRVFITSLDGRIVRIYPISIWLQNENLFDELGDEAQDAEDIALIASDFGAESVVDSQGRVLIKQNLRERLSMESQPVWLSCYKGVIDVYTREMYQERTQRAMQDVDAKLRRLKQKGMR